MGPGARLELEDRAQKAEGEHQRLSSGSRQLPTRLSREDRPGRRNARGRQNQIVRAVKRLACSPSPAELESEEREQPSPSRLDPSVLRLSGSQQTAARHRHGAGDGIHEEILHGRDIPALPQCQSGVPGNVYARS